MKARQPCSPTIVSMTRLYLDNAATSFPKPPSVTAAMVRYASEVGGSAGRGTYAEAMEGGRIVRQCRDIRHRQHHLADDQRRQSDAERAERDTKCLIKVVHGSPSWDR